MSQIRTVCIDSMLCVWGIKKVASKGQEEKILLAESLIETLSKEKAALLLPTPIITELLTPVPPQDHSKLLRHLTSYFELFQLT
jgi:hypothetical protein